MPALPDYNDLSERYVYRDDVYGITFSNSNYNIRHSDSLTNNATSSKESSNEQVVDGDTACQSVNAADGSGTVEFSDKFRSKIALGVKQLISMAENSRQTAATQGNNNSCSSATEVVPINVAPSSSSILSRSVAPRADELTYARSTEPSTFKEPKNSATPLWASTPHEYGGARPKSHRSSHMQSEQNVYTAYDTSPDSCYQTPVHSAVLAYDAEHTQTTASAADYRARRKYLSYAEGTDYSSYYSGERSGRLFECGGGDNKIRRLLSEMRSSRSSPLSSDVNSDVVNDDKESGVIFCTPGTS